MAAAPEMVRADGALLTQILDDTWPQWGDGLSRPAYERWNAAQLRTPWGGGHLERVALVDGGTLRCSAKRYRITLRLDGRDLPAVGIGAVFTPAAQRGQGYAGQLIERICADEARDGCALAMLFSEIGPRYYERLGFRAVPHATCDIAVAVRAGAPAMLVRAGDDHDAAHVAQMHVARLQRYRFGLVPDADLVRYSVAKKRMLAGFDSSGRRSLEYFVTEEGYQAVAYVLMQVTRARRAGQPESWSLAACGDRDPAGARVGAMLQVLLARQPAEHLPVIRAWWPAGFNPPQLEIARRGLAAEVMMVRPLAAALRIQPWLAEGEAMFWHGDAF